MMYILNSRLGRLGAAKKALERAIEINPTEPAWRHNYAVLLEKNDAKAALKYLENQPEHIKQETSVKCKLALLKNKVKSDASGLHKIVQDYKNDPAGFSDFDKRVLLKQIFSQVGEPYAYVDPKTKRRKEDEGKYLDMNNLPF